MQYAPAPVVVFQQNNNKTLAIILEIVGGLFGIFGIGWLVAGKSKVGIPLLIGSVVWFLIEIVALIFTLGIGIVCVGPIDLIVLIVSAIMLNNSFNTPSVGMAVGAVPVAQYSQPPQYPQQPQYPQYPQPPQYPQQ